MAKISSFSFVLDKVPEDKFDEFVERIKELANEMNVRARYRRDGRSSSPINDIDGLIDG